MISTSYILHACVSSSHLPIIPSSSSSSSCLSRSRCCHGHRVIGPVLPRLVFPLLCVPRASRYGTARCGRTRARQQATLPQLLQQWWRYKQQHHHHHHLVSIHIFSVFWGNMGHKCFWGNFHYSSAISNISSSFSPNFHQKFGCPWQLTIIFIL